MRISKKILFVFSTMLFGLVSCTSCTKKEQLAPGLTCNDASCPLPQPDSSVKDQVYSDTDWEITIPAGWEKQEPSPTGTLVMVSNKEKYNLILFFREEFKGTHEDYVLLSVRQLKQINAKLLSVSQVEANGVNYSLIESEKNNITVWVWVATKNNYGYALTCGGKTVDSWNKPVCTTVFNSIKLK